VDILSKIKEIKIVPVVVLNNVDETKLIMEQLSKGQIPIAEITFRTSCAKECLKLAVESFPEMNIGVGTIINKKQCQEAIECGAKFIVSPGLSVEVAEYCKEKNVLYIPGVITPTEIMKAISLGLTTLKFFPAEIFGGVKALKALCAAFPNVYFMPTGGIDLSLIKEYLSFEKIIAVGGSWMMKGLPEYIHKKCLETIKVIKGE